MLSSNEMAKIANEIFRAAGLKDLKAVVIPLKTLKSEYDARVGVEITDKRHQWLTIFDADVELKTIFHKKRVGGYLATYVRVIPATHHEPEDADIIEITPTNQSFEFVVKQSVLFIIENKINDWAEAKAEETYEKELETYSEDVDEEFQRKYIRRS